MKKNGGNFLAVAFLALGLFVCSHAQPRKLTILHANDTHSAMVPIEAGFAPLAALEALQKNGDTAGISNPGNPASGQDHAGIARMAALIKKLKASNPNVLALHAGDVFVGSFEFNKYLGYPELKIMENLYDAMALGNHEFDLGIDTLAGILSGQMAGGAPVYLPVLCANFDSTGTALQGLVQPSIIKTTGGIKVGIFGLVTQEPQNYSDGVNSRFPYPYEAASPEDTLWYYAGQVAGGLKAQDCDVVICLSHLGASLDMVLADNVPFIDVIVGGHSHDVFEQPVIRSGKIIVQAGEYGKYLGELNLKIDNDGSIELDSYRLHKLDSRAKEDPHVRAMVNQVRAGVVSDPRFGPVYSQKIAHARRDIQKSWPAGSQNRDVAMGNLVTDAYKAELNRAGFQVDCAITVLGYIGADIKAGKVVGNDILRAVPYGYDPVSGLGFKVVVVSLPGSLLLGGLEYAAGMVEFTRDLAVQASGLTYAYDSTKPTAGLGETPTRVNVMSVMINGEHVALNLNKLYSVAMNEQVFNFFNALVGGTLTPLVTPTGLF
ncbi:MAG: bifunctional metallophosphatase/5'-nucleotidase, partial [Candidatus Aminicenantes bacterium]|nr:bifunctional metallophosphatase/5'-nucleotidase [Candidatus Aminicenantes bacterium]